MTGPERLDEIGESVGNALLSQAGRLSSRYHEKRGLEADVLESDDAYMVVFDAPGATSSDLQVRYLDGRVLVRLDRFRAFHEGFEMRFPGRGLSLDGDVALPGDAVVDATAARATLTDNGTLQIELPKAADPGVDRGGIGGSEPEEVTEDDGDETDGGGPGTDIEETTDDEDDETEAGDEDGEGETDDGEGETDEDSTAEEDDTGSDAETDDGTGSDADGEGADADTDDDPGSGADGDEGDDEE